MTRARVMIAEDETLIAEELRDRLGEMGHLVTDVVASGTDAIARAKETVPDLVLMDIRLKGDVDGIEAAAAIRVACQIPVVYLTAHSDEATLTRAKRTEPFGYLLKPFDENDLRVTLELALHRQEAERRLRARGEQSQSEELRRKAEEHQLAGQAMHAVGQLAGGVAHEINNHMQVIIGFGELLLKEIDPLDPRYDLIVQMRDAGGLAAITVRHLLAIGRKQVLVPAIVDLNDIVARAIPMLRQAIGDDVEIACRFDRELPRVRIDPGEMELAIMKLALHARDAMSYGGTLTFETRPVMVTEPDPDRLPEMEPGRYAMLSITDTGHGMDAHAVRRVFEPFSTMKGLDHGTGLELAAAHGLIKQSGGHVYVESEPERGTTFKIYLAALTNA